MRIPRHFLVAVTALGLQAGPVTLAQSAEPAAGSSLPWVTAEPANGRPPPATPALGPGWPPAPDMTVACPAGDGICAPAGRVIGGGGLYVIQPYFTTNPAYNLFRETKAGSFDSTTTSRVDVPEHMAVAPLAWLGYLSDSGLGGRVRWWSFAQGSSQSLTFRTSTGATEATLTSATPLGPVLFVNTGDGKSAQFSTTSQLRLQVGDIEGLQQFSACRWTFLLCGGLRVAYISQDYNAFVSQKVDASTQQETLVSAHRFTGVGPVAAVEARRRLGCSGLALYGSARGSVLFGSATQNAQSTGSIGDPSPINVSAHWDPVLTTAELEGGLEYGRVVGPWRVFGQVALVGQEWFGVGNASRSAQGGMPTGFPLSNATTDSNLGFFGLVVRLGITY
jgi:hypothetical protein